jgi:hypothetical protein
MADLKHVGRLVSNKRKVVVAFRTLPGDPYSALVISTENLNDRDHDALIKVVESNAGQTAYELADALDRASLPETADNMLSTFHKRGILTKISTKDVEMVPNASTSILLSDLNQVIAEQRGIGLEDLTVKPGSNAQVTEVASINKTVDTAPADAQPSQSNDSGVLSDEDLAAQYRSQADAMYKEAKRLRAEADELSPTKKKSVGKKTT